MSNFIEHIDPYLLHYNIKPGDVVVDLGAGTGVFGRVFMDQLKQPGVKFIMVEGTPGSANVLTSQFKQYGWIIINKLISSKDGVEEFVITDQSALNYKKDTNQDIKRIGQEHYEIQTIQMPTISLDSIINMYGKIDFIKSDIEASEVEVFMNCSQIDKIKNGAIGAYHLLNGEQTWVKLKPFLEEKGFNTILYPNHEHNNETQLYFSREPLTENK